jgi:diguanylate cyclase (GGDEF)-like protein
MISTALQRWKPGRLTTWALGVLFIAAIGLFDFASGTELRVYPLYLAPVAFLAWYAGRRGAVVAAVLSASAWVYGNYAAGMQFSSPNIWVANAALHVVSFLLVGFVIAILRQSRAEAEVLSRTDSLTQLLNSRAFYSDAVPLLALCKRGGRPVTVAYIDLDNFKLVNDRHGHAAGDTLLARIADEMRRTLRPSDLCARLGGDEFALLLPELPESEAAGVLERVRTRVADAARSIEPAVTASIGGVTFLKAPAALEDLVHRADELMYAAKQGGRNALSLKVHDG